MPDASIKENIYLASFGLLSLRDDLRSQLAAERSLGSLHLSHVWSNLQGFAAHETSLPQNMLGSRTRERIERRTARKQTHTCTYIDRIGWDGMGWDRVDRR